MKMACLNYTRQSNGNYLIAGDSTVYTPAQMYSKIEDLFLPIVGPRQADVHYIISVAQNGILGAKTTAGTITHDGDCGFMPESTQFKVTTYGPTIKPDGTNIDNFLTLDYTMGRVDGSLMLIGANN